MHGTMRWLAAVGLALVAGCSGSGWGSLQQAQANLHKTASVQGVRLVIVETQNGSVDAHCDLPGELADITVTKHAQAGTMEAARERLEQIQIVVEREADKPQVLHIKAQVPHFANGSAGARFRLGLPPDVGVTIRTSNGDAIVTAARGDLDLVTSNGRIQAESIGGVLLARTSNGSIMADHVAGNIDAVTSNGGIDLEQVGREYVKATTSNARIRVIDPRGEVTLVSSNSPIELKARSLPPEPRVHIETSNSSVHVTLPCDLRATLRLQTNNAGVHANLSGAQVTDQQGGESNLSAVLNGGGGKIAVATSNGPIDFTLAEAQPPTAEAPGTAPAGNGQ